MKLKKIKARKTKSKWDVLIESTKLSPEGGIKSIWQNFYALFSSFLKQIFNAGWCFLTHVYNFIFAFPLEKPLQLTDNPNWKMPYITHIQFEMSLSCLRQK